MPKGGSAKRTSKKMPKGGSAERTSKKMAALTVESFRKENIPPERTSTFDGIYLYRCLGEDEDCVKGLTPEDPKATYSVTQHVRGHPRKQKQKRYKTQYISTCASLRSARECAKLSQDPSSIRIAKIDVGKMMKTNKIIDLTDPMVRILLLADEWMRDDARRFEQVLVTGHITSDCLTQTEPRDVDDLCRFFLMQNQCCSFRIYDIPGPTGPFHGKCLYRCLRKDEDWKKDLTPKDPDATYSVHQHVRGRPKQQQQLKTQYISTCASLSAARAWAAKRKHRSSIHIVKIDVDKMQKTNKIINLTDPIAQILLLAHGPVRNYANRYQEVLVTGHITSDCLTLPNPWDDDDVDEITEWKENLDMAINLRLSQQLSQMNFNSCSLSDILKTKK